MLDHSLSSTTAVNIASVNRRSYDMPILTWYVGASLSLDHPIHRQFIDGDCSHERRYHWIGPIEAYKEYKVHGTRLVIS